MGAGHRRLEIHEHLRVRREARLLPAVERVRATRELDGLGLPVSVVVVVGASVKTV